MESRSWDLNQLLNFEQNHYKQLNLKLAMKIMQIHIFSFRKLGCS